MTQTKQHCSTPDQLITFLQGQLSACEEADLQQHLDDCLPCRERLEYMAADANAWNEAREFLGNGALHASSKDVGEEHEEASQGSQLIRQVLESLGPTDDPESLGRIGGYEVTGVVGAGGMGVVLKAHDRSLDRIVAIKVMSPHLASSGSARKRFAREAKAAAAVLHPNVIAIHSVASEDANPYLVMPFVRGTSLQKRIDSQGPLPLKDTLRIGAQIAAGLAAAHGQGLVHRDIKPANILLEEGVERVTITDFGLARAVDDASMTCSGVIAGTPQYMSPEQARGEPIDARSDLFSLGGVLYAMCTGRSPFRAETTYGVLHRIANDSPTPVCDVNTDVPDWLGHVIDRLMAKRPEDRFESGDQVAELLEGCLAHVQQPAAMPLPEALAALAPKKTRRPPIGKFMAAAAGAFALFFAGILVVLELDKGTLTIESEMDNVPIRIMQGDTVVDRLTVTRSGNSVRVAAGTYIVELDTELDGIVVENDQVSLKRGEKGQVRIRHAKSVVKASEDSPTFRFETPDALMKHAANCQTKGDGPGFMDCWTDQAFKDFVPSYLLTSIMQLQYFENAPHSKPRHPEELLELKQILAEEFGGNEAGKSLLAVALAHKEIADRSADKFAEAAEATAESPLVQLLASSSTNLINSRRFIMKLAALHEKYEEPGAKKEPRVFAYTVEQDGNNAVATETTGKNQFGLIKTEAGWRINDVFYGLKQQDESASVAPEASESATAISSTAETFSIPEETAKIIVDVYGGNRVLGQNNAKYVKLVQDLNAIEGVQVNFREAGSGSDIAMAIVRAPASLINQEAFTTGNPSARRDAISKALVQIPNVRWEEGGQTSAPPQNATVPDTNSVNLRSSETHEVVLSMGTLKFMLDLDTGETCSAPARDSDYLNKFDVNPKQNQPQEEPHGLTLRSLNSTSLRFDTVSVAPEIWNCPDAAIFSELATAKPNSLPEIPLHNSAQNTYYFRTAQGTPGLLQLIGTERIKGEVNEPWGIRIRYKILRSVDFERATNSVERVFQYLSAVQQKDTATIKSIVKGRIKFEPREKDIAKLLGEHGIPKLHKMWFENHSAIVALGPVSSSDGKVDDRFLLFTLSLVDERWSIVDIDLEAQEPMLARFEALRLKSVDTKLPSSSYSIEANTTGHGHAPKVGSRIDLLVNIHDPDPTNPEVRTVVQNALVIATHDSRENETVSRDVTIELQLTDDEINLVKSFEPLQAFTFRPLEEDRGLSTPGNPSNSVKMQEPSSFETKLHELDALRKNRKTTVAEVDKLIQELAESYPNQLGRIHWHATHLYGQSGIKEFSDQVIAHATRSLALEKNSVQRAYLFMYLSNANEVVGRRTIATDWFLKGWMELQPYNLPEKAPELPSVGKYRSLIANPEGEDFKEKAELAQRLQEAEQKQREEAKLVIELVNFRSIYLDGLKRLNPTSEDQENLRKKAREMLGDGDPILGWNVVDELMTRLKF